MLGLMTWAGVAPGCYRTRVRGPRIFSGDLGCPFIFGSYDLGRGSPWVWPHPGPGPEDFLGGPRMPIFIYTYIYSDGVVSLSMMCLLYIHFTCAYITDVTDTSDGIEGYSGAPLPYPLHLLFDCLCFWSASGCCAWNLIIFKFVLVSITLSVCSLMLGLPETCALVASSIHALVILSSQQYFKSAFSALKLFFA